jgi:hypothetical protein
MSYKTGQTTLPNGFKIIISFNKEDKPAVVVLVDEKGIGNQIPANGFHRISRENLRKCLEDANFVPLLERIPVSSEECDFELLKVGEL